MSFVIAAGTGAVGSKVTRGLLAQGEQVRVLTRDAARASENLGSHEGLSRDRRGLVQKCRPLPVARPRAQTSFVSFELRYASCEEEHDGDDDSSGGSGVPAA